MSTAIVTGASRGFGLALAVELAGEGWDLVVDARGRDDLERAAATIEAAGTGRLIALDGDVTDEPHVEDLVDAAVSLGDFTLLVNNASLLGPSPQPNLADYPIPALEEVFATNVTAPLRIIQRSLPHLRRAGGTIINITSDAAVEGYEGWGGYGAAKAALEQLSNVLSAEEPDVVVRRVQVLGVQAHREGERREVPHHRVVPERDVAPALDPERRPHHVG